MDIWTFAFFSREVLTSKKVLHRKFDAIEFTATERFSIELKIYLDWKRAILDQQNGQILHSP